MAAQSPVTVRIADGLAWVRVDNPPVNATSTAVRAGLVAALGQLVGTRAAILHCAGRTFIAGGDISEFDAPPVAPHLPDVVDAIEASDIPWIAAMHGTVLGGGFEIAMACAFRIAAPGTKFGLPEVNLGLVPGAGGTQRLPRLIGLEAAARVACEGKLLTAEELLALGGLDLIADEPLAAAADLRAERAPPVSARPVVGGEAMQGVRAKIVSLQTKQSAPGYNLDLLELATKTPFTEGQKQERALHLKLRQSAESKALRHIFLAERQAARPHAIGGAKPRDLTRIAIVGGGLMGAGIAAACLSGRLRVTVIERDDCAANDARQRIADLLDGALRRGKITAQDHADQLASLSTGTEVTQADIAIEAVFEDIATKRKVFTKLADTLAEGTILATNTSYLDPREIFAGIPNQARCLGLHFFSPAHVMKLLEIVRTPETSPDTLATAFAFAKRLGKQPVLSGICDGFIGNRMLAAYRREADYLLADGCLPQQIDAAMRDFGMPMGPYELQDLTGLQIAWANRKRQARPARYVPIADRLCEAGRLGQRAGRGWYAYSAGSRTPEPDPEVETIILACAKEAGIARRAFTADDIRIRLLAVLANEGALIVEEGIAATPGDVDVVQVHGYAFPRWTGGPMHHAATLDAASAMRKVAAESPGAWTISRLLGTEAAIA